MSDHLPECIYTPERFDPEQNIVWDGKPCICDRLRACEQRVDDENFRLLPAYDRARQQGYAAALDAAREAVAAVGVRKDTSHDMRVQALAAIDALRGERK